MQTNVNQKKSNSTINIYSYSDESVSSSNIILLSNSKSMATQEFLINEMEIGENLFVTSMTTPDFNGYIMGVYRGQPFCVLVGEESKKRFIYYGIDEQQSIPYDVMDGYGNLTRSGNLSEIGLGFYMDPDLPNKGTSVYDVNGAIFWMNPEISTEASATSGEIKIQNNVWQLIAIPRNGSNVKEYFVDRLATKYGLDSSLMIESCNAFFGSENKFRTYIPGVTNSGSSNNFPLVSHDDGADEITGFWVKTKDLTGLVDDVNNVKISWEA